MIIYLKYNDGDDDDEIDDDDSNDGDSDGDDDDSNDGDRDDDDSNDGDDDCDDDDDSNDGDQDDDGSFIALCSSSSFPLFQSLVRVIWSFVFSLSFISCTCVSSVRLKHGSVDVKSSSDSKQSREGDLIKRYPSGKHDFDLSCSSLRPPHNPFTFNLL